MLKLFQAVLVVLACALVGESYGQVGCPADTQSRLMGCVEPLQALMSSPSAQQHKCGAAREGIACIHDVFNACENLEESQLRQMMEGFQMMEQQVNSICGAPQTEAPEPEPPAPNTEAPPTEAPSSNAIGSCSRRDKRKLQKCARRMQRYAVESPIRCQKVRKAMDCMSTLMDRCRATIESGTFDRVNSLRQNIMAACVETNDIDENEEEDDEDNEEPDNSCPAGYMQMLTDCSKPMERLNPEMGKEHMCRVMTTAVECLDDVMTRCENEPDIQMMSSMVNIDETKAMVRSQCSGAPLPLPETGVESNENCPSNYEQRFLECASPMQALSSGSSSFNLEQSCSIASDGLGCLNQVLTDCAGKPEVQALLRMINFDELQNLVSSQCTHVGGNGGNGQCPSGYMERMNNCVTPLERLDEMSNQEDICSLMNSALHCVDDIMEKCASAPDIQAMSRMLNLDHVRGLVNGHCSGAPLPTVGAATGNDENCPADYIRKVEECAGKLDSLSSNDDPSLACSVATDGLGCLEEIFNDCSGKPEIQAIRGMINLDEMQSMLRTQCSTLSALTNGNSCQYGDPSQQLIGCNQLLNTFQDESASLAARCRSVFRGFDCFDELINSCPTDDAVMRFTSLVDISEARQALQGVCS